jgi:hypothetical protein
VAVIKAITRATIKDNFTGLNNRTCRKNHVTFIYNELTMTTVTSNISLHFLPLMWPRAGQGKASRVTEGQGTARAGQRLGRAVEFTDYHVLRAIKLPLN